MTDYQRLTPESTLPEWNDASSFLFVMSEWSHFRDMSTLFHLIDSKLQNTASHKPMPTMIVIDDLDIQSMEYQELLDHLSEAGAHVIQAIDEDEQILIRSDVMRFAENLLAASQRATPVTPSNDYQKWLKTQSSPAPSLQPPQIPPPVNLDGYKDFAKAITRLSAKDLKEMMDPSN